MTEAGPDLLTADVATGEESDTGLLIAPPKASAFKRMVQTIGWSGFTVLCLIGFTILKFPQTRIKGLVIGHLSAALAPMGISLTANETEFSVWRGPRLILTDVTLSLPPPNLPLRLNEIEVAPSLLALFRGRWGASLSVDQASNTAAELSIDVSVPIKDGLTMIRDLDLKLDLEDWNLMQFGLPRNFPVKLTGQFPVSGFFRFKGNFAIPNTWNTRGELALKNIVFEQINALGMVLPSIRAKDGELKWNGGGSKLEVEKIRIGSPSDGFYAELNGDLLLGASQSSTTMKLKTKFKPSPELLRAVSFIDVFLATYKRDDMYVFELAGPLLQPAVQPAAP